MKTTIAYVVSPEWEHILYASLGSLFSSGSNFDEVKVICVGGKMKSNFGKCDVIEVKNVSKNNFLENKTHIEGIKTDRLAFLDADTIVLDELDKVWESEDADFIARKDQHYCSKNFEEEKWYSVLEEEDANVGPYFNSGFFVFQNRSHSNLEWRNTCRKYVEKPPKLLHGERWVEQISLSVAVHKSGLSYSCINEKDHLYGWEHEMGEPKSLTGVKVYHTGAAQFFPSLSRIYFDGDVNLYDREVSSLRDSSFYKMILYMVSYYFKYWVLRLE
jgi:hypothetical protein